MDGIKKKGIEVLRYTEKYTKTDMVYLAKGGFWALISQFVVSSSVFLLAIAFANFVPKEVYGEYKYILSLVSILSALSLTGMNTAVLQSVSQGFDGSLRYAFWQNLKWSVFFFVGCLITAGYYFLHNNTGLGISMLIAGCFWPLLSSTNLYSSFLSGKKDFRRNALYFDIAGNLFPFACIFITMFISKSPLALVAAYFISNTLVGVFLYTKILTIYTPGNNVDPEMLRYSKHLSFIGILAGIAENIDQVLVFHFIGPAELAIYNFATAIPDQIKGPIKYLNNLIFPKFTERDNTEIRAGMKNKMFYLFVTSLVIIGVYILSAPYIFKIFFPQYIHSVLYSQIFSISILMMVSTPANTYLSAKKKIKEKYIENIGWSVAQILFVSIGVIFWGLMGLIISRVFVRLISSGISVILYNTSSQQTTLS